ncbi:MAG: organic solvent tolerance protein [Novosphingobium sp. 12-64-8]|nr:MAG: organic solvent tolerance protein [Novosphingobium sp. 12-64-8]
MQPAPRPQPQAFHRCLRTRRLAASAALSAIALALWSPAFAQDAPATANVSPAAEEQIRFEADKLQYANDADTVTANGNVVLRREDQTVRADSVTWNRKTGQIEAAGNIRFVDQDGNILYTDKVELTDELKAGAVEDLLLVLREGGRLAARGGERDATGNLVLRDAAYTGCSVEDDSGCPKKPSWEITAVKVSYNNATKRVKYKGATLRVFGIPLLPLPGLAHTSDFRAESGLLIPDLRLGASNGVEISDTYYLRLAENKDLAITGYVFTQALPMVSAKYRQLMDNGAFQITGYVTQSSRINVGGITVDPSGQKDFRGYFEANGKFQFDENWSVTGYGRYASDRTFLRRYDISRDDRLRSSVNLERIGDNSYFSLAGWGIQTLRTGDSQGLVPIALPALDYRRRLNVPIGGKLELEANSVAITRTSGQDTQRAFARAQWDLRKITGLGQELTFTALVRGDVYHSDENALTATALYRGNPGWQARGIATAAVDLKWPLIGSFLGGTQVFTPRFQIVATPHVRNIEIPNEDSRSVELEDTNIFTLNRFPGNDRIEDGLRFTYGFDWQLTRPGWRISTTVGQSHRLSTEQTLLPDGTGLSTRTSDIVGRTNLRFRDLVQFTHRYRLDKDSLALRRNEFDATIGNHRTYAEIGYLRLNRNIPTTFEDLRDREELRLAGRVAFAKYWSVFGSAVVNLTNRDEDPTNNSDGFEMLRHRLGVAYTDDCLDLAFTWRRDYVTTGDASKGNTFQVSFSLRNIGVK